MVVMVYVSSVLLLYAKFDSFNRKSESSRGCRCSESNEATNHRQCYHCASSTETAVLSFGSDLRQCSCRVIGTLQLVHSSLLMKISTVRTLGVVADVILRARTLKNPSIVCENFVLFSVLF